MLVEQKVLSLNRKFSVVDNTLLMINPNGEDDSETFVVTRVANVRNQLLRVNYLRPCSHPRGCTTR